MNDEYADVDPQSVDWPFPVTEFVRASRLVEEGATDDEVRRAVRAVEDGGDR